MQKEIITLHDVSIGVTEELISGITLVVKKGDRIALLGPNGSGKTTLLKTIIGEEEPFHGSIKRSGKIILVEQIKTNNKENLSGGENSLAAINYGFEQSPDLLILDEPTNHLDFLARQSLIEKIRVYKGAVICVSHDSWFLEQITKSLLFVEEGRLRSFQGSYHEYKKEISANNSGRERRLESVKKEQRKINESKIREQKKGSRSEKENKKQKTDKSMGRMEIGFKKETAGNTIAKNKKLFDKKQEEIFEKITKLSVIKKKKVSGTIISSSREGSLFTITDADVFIGNRTVLQNISLLMKSKERIVLVGRNGSGKSSLVKGLLQIENFSLVPRAYINPSMRIEYLDQHYSLVNLELSVLENVVIFGEVSSERARQHLAHFLFDDSYIVAKKVKELSGGMITRLAFVMLTVSPIDLLILDEPTNNLDRDTISSIIELLNEFKGSLLVITHDVQFIKDADFQKIAVLSEGVLKTMIIEDVDDIAGFLENNL